MSNVFVLTSKAGLGMVLVTLLGFVFPLLGIEAPEGSIVAFVDALGQVLGFVLMVIGQFDRKDLKYGIIRK